MVRTADDPLTVARAALEANSRALQSVERERQQAHARAKSLLVAKSQAESRRAGRLERLTRFLARGGAAPAVEDDHGDDERALVEGAMADKALGEIDAGLNARARALAEERQELAQELRRAVLDEVRRERDAAADGLVDALEALRVAAARAYAARLAEDRLDHDLRGSALVPRPHWPVQGALELVLAGLQMEDRLRGHEHLVGRSYHIAELNWRADAVRLADELEGKLAR